MRWRKVNAVTWRPAGTYYSAAIHKVEESYRITFGSNAFITGTTIPTLKEAKEIVEKTIETLEAYDEPCCQD
jgi:hypothetical protein